MYALQICLPSMQEVIQLFAVDQVKLDPEILLNICIKFFSGIIIFAGMYRFSRTP